MNHDDVVKILDSLKEGRKKAKEITDRYVNGGKRNEAKLQGMLCCGYGRTSALRRTTWMQTGI